MTSWSGSTVPLADLPGRNYDELLYDIHNWRLEISAEDTGSCETRIESGDSHSEPAPPESDLDPENARKQRRTEGRANLIRSAIVPTDQICKALVEKLDAGLRELQEMQAATRRLLDPHYPRSKERETKASEPKKVPDKEPSSITNGLEKGRRRCLEDVTSWPPMRIKGLKSDINRNLRRLGNLERAILGYRQANDAVVWGRVLSDACYAIYEAACTAFEADLPMDKPFKETNQFRLLSRCLKGGWHSVDMGQLLDDVSFLLEVTSQDKVTKKHDVTGQSKAAQLRQKLSEQLTAQKIRRMITVAKRIESTPVKRHVAAKAVRKRKYLDLLLNFLVGSETNLTSNSLVRAIDNENPSDLPYVSWSKLSRTDKIERLGEELDELFAVDKISLGSRASKELDVLTKSIWHLQRGSDLMNLDEAFFNKYILDYDNSIRFPPLDNYNYLLHLLEKWEKRKSSSHGQAFQL